jgi:hypothetical protein
MYSQTRSNSVTASALWCSFRVRSILIFQREFRAEAPAPDFFNKLKPNWNRSVWELWIARYEFDIDSGFAIRKGKLDILEYICPFHFNEDKFR